MNGKPPSDVFSAVQFFDNTLEKQISVKTDPTKIEENIVRAFRIRAGIIPSLLIVGQNVLVAWVSKDHRILVVSCIGGFFGLFAVISSVNGLMYRVMENKPRRGVLFGIIGVLFDAAILAYLNTVEQEVYSLYPCVIASCLLITPLVSAVINKLLCKPVATVTLFQGAASMWLTCVFACLYASRRMKLDGGWQGNFSDSVIAFFKDLHRNNGIPLIFMGLNIFFDVTDRCFRRLVYGDELFIQNGGLYDPPHTQERIVQNPNKCTRGMYEPDAVGAINWIIGKWASVSYIIGILLAWSIVLGVDGKGFGSIVLGVLTIRAILFCIADVYLKMV